TVEEIPANKPKSNKRKPPFKSKDFSKNKKTTHESPEDIEKYLEERKKKYPRENSTVKEPENFKSQNSRNKVCKFYMKGKCKYGSKCLYAHELILEKPQIIAPKALKVEEEEVDDQFVSEPLDRDSIWKVIRKVALTLY